jgi:hypothetical protein
MHFATPSFEAPLRGAPQDDDLEDVEGVWK